MIQRELELPSGFESPEDYVEALVSFIDQYRWLPELHVIDFFSLHHWNLLDPEWQVALLEGSDQPGWFESIIQIASFDGTVSPNWPESLKEYIQKAQALVLPRRVAKEC
ncbi:hypothetical protein BX666DRAFT_1873336 [Dichotomocladium elegans]|nr:hypothetical protein BX666DRAFT_1873336 [Dichotomocladium elegans]